MKIEKAIESLNDIRELNLNYYSPARKAALQLGISALKRVKKARHYKHDLTQVLLPGETEK